MILARANAGRHPAVLARLLPLADRGRPGSRRSSGRELNGEARACCCLARLAGRAGRSFFGMFLCGGPIYIAGVSTTAINIALIYALSPIVVLVISWLDRPTKRSAASS